MTLHSDKKTVLSDMSSGLQSAIWIFPLTLSMGVCSGAGIYAGLISAVIASVVSCFSGGALIAPTWIIFLVFMLASYSCGVGGAFAAVLLACATVALIIAFDEGNHIAGKFVDGKLIALLLPAAALCMTTMETTLYFGIGASGDTERAIIADYISLGFHPNWRDVLYGTVTLVIMITYPRKFKSLRDKLPAAFISIIATLGLNFLLNPNASTTAINEIGSYSLSFSELFACPLFVKQFDFTGGFVSLLLSTLSMAAILLCSLEKNDGISKRARILAAFGSASCTFVGGIPMTVTEKKFRGFLSGTVCAVFGIALFAASPLVARIPIPTLAVILITSAWQAVDWHGIRVAFSGRGTAVNIVTFILIMLLAVSCGLSAAITAACILSLIQKKSKKEVNPQ